MPEAETPPALPITGPAKGMMTGPQNSKIEHGRIVGAVAIQASASRQSSSLPLHYYISRRGGHSRRIFFHWLRGAPLSADWLSRPNHEVLPHGPPVKGE